MQKNILYVCLLLCFLGSRAYAQTPQKTASPQQLRAKAINAYIGNPLVSTVETKRLIEQLYNMQDPVAKAWKGVFRYLGAGGFPPNEEHGLTLALETKNMLVEKSAAGDPEATYLLYFAKLMGVYGGQEVQSAGKLIEQAAARNYTPALMAYGTQLYYQKQYPEAMQYLNKAYAAGAKKAATLIGTLYENSLYPEKDFQKAVEWHQKGAAAGDGEAMLNLARFYYGGEEVKPNMSECLKWANQGAAKGHLGSLCFLGEIYLQDNEGKPKNTALALKSYATAAEKGAEKPCWLWGRCIMTEKP